jgi:hypothetical protein
MEWCPKCQKLVNTSTRRQRKKVWMLEKMIQYTQKNCEECRQTLVFNTELIEMPSKKKEEV